MTSSKLYTDNLKRWLNVELITDMDDHTKVDEHSLTLLTTSAATASSKASSSKHKRPNKRQRYPKVNKRPTPPQTPPSSTPPSSTVCDIKNASLSSAMKHMVFDRQDPFITESCYDPEVLDWLMWLIMLDTNETDENTFVSEGPPYLNEQMLFGDQYTMLQ